MKYNTTEMEIFQFNVKYLLITGYNMKMLPGMNNKHSREDKYTKTVLHTLMSIISELIF